MKKIFNTMLALAFSTSAQIAMAQCSQPSNLNALNLTPTSTMLSWAPAPGALNHTVQYRIQGTTAWIAVPGLLVNNHTLTGLLETTIYQWRVRGNCSTYSSINLFNSGGSGNNTSCSQPSNLNANMLSPTSVSLTWSDLPEAFNYTLQYRRVGVVAWTTVSNIMGTQRNVNNLLVNTEYQFRVKASCSVYSSITSFNTSFINNCDVPANQVSANVSTTSATLLWDAVAGATEYIVQYRVQGTNAFTTVDPVLTNSVAITGLTANAAYEWRVKADCGIFSSLAQFTATSGGGTQCSAPSNTNTAVVTSSTATVEWETVAEAVDYTVEYRLETASVYTLSGVVTTAFTTITGLAANTAYIWRVKANCSPNGSDVQFTTLGRAPEAGGTDLSASSTTLFPNPVNGTNAVLQGAPYGTLLVLDQQGRTVAQETVIADRHELSTASLNAGMYTVRMADGNMVRLVVAQR